MQNLSLPRSWQYLVSASPAAKVVAFSILLLLLAVLFISINLIGNISYVLPRRFWMLCSIVLVGCAAGMATVLFQTISQNRILTPAVMGFESLFVLLQTAMVFVLGADSDFYSSRLLRFACEAALMISFALVLYRWLFSANRGLHILLLVGLVFGIFFHSIANLLQRLLLPSEFDVLQGRLFARLSLPDPTLLLVAAAVLLLAACWIWRLRYHIDVLSLGRENAIALGVNYQRLVTQILILVAVLVAISTALIGPLTFLGFLAATLAYQIAGTFQHRYLLPLAAVLGSIFLLGSQLIFEHVLGMAGVVTVVIEFIGGTLFLIVLLKRGRL